MEIKGVFGSESDRGGGYVEAEEPKNMDVVGAVSGAGGKGAVGGGGVTEFATENGTGAASEKPVRRRRKNCGGGVAEVLSSDASGKTVRLQNGKVVRRCIGEEERQKIWKETARKARAAAKEKRELRAAEEAATRAEREQLKAVAASKMELGEAPLEDPKEEKWCQLVASGVKTAEAYQVAYKDDLGKPRESYKNATSHASRVGKTPRMQDRLGYLRKETAKAASVGRVEKLEMVEAVMRGLMEDFKSGERGRTVSDLQGMLAMHNQMTGETERPKLEIKLDLGGLMMRSDADIEKRLGLSN